MSLETSIKWNILAKSVTTVYLPVADWIVSVKSVLIDREMETHKERHMFQGHFKQGLNPIDSCP